MAEAPSAAQRKRTAASTKILDATSELIAERGLDGFTISEVAKRADINRALIYHYFHDRDNLIAQAIRHIIARHDGLKPGVGPEAIEGLVRLHIEHPEIGRVFFQMLMSKRPLPLPDRMLSAIEELERIRRERAPDVPFDATFAVVIATLAQLAWGFARTHIADELGMPVEEADERIVAQMRRAAAYALRSLNTPVEETATRA